MCVANNTLENILRKIYAIQCNKHTCIGHYFAIRDGVNIEEIFF